MSRLLLGSRDVALLARLNSRPIEIGELPPENMARLSSLGFAQKVLGCFEITRAGQLAYRRYQFLKIPRKRFSRVTRSNPMVLQEANLRVSAARPGIRDLHRRVPKWLRKIYSDVSGKGDSGQAAAEQVK